jgi:hypothetical protein
MTALVPKPSNVAAAQKVLLSNITAKKQPTCYAGLSQSKGGATWFGTQSFSP